MKEDENLEAVSPRRCQGRGCSRGLNFNAEKGWAYCWILCERNPSVNLWQKNKNIYRKKTKIYKNPGNTRFIVAFAQYMHV
jgi:hypothetical protein